MTLQNTSNIGGGEFVRERDVADAKAILFEPKRFEKDVPGGKFGPQDILTTDLTIFDGDALKGDKAPEFIKNAKLVGAGVTREYGEGVGQQFVGRLVLTPSAKGNAFYAPKPVDDSVFDAVAAYLEQREAAVEAALESDGPPWAG